MRDIHGSQKPYLLGTAIRITIALEDLVTATCTITIFDPSETKKVDEASMTKEVDSIYYYVFQTTKTWDTGVYTAYIDVVSGSYTARQEIKIECKEEDIDT